MAEERNAKAEKSSKAEKEVLEDEVRVDLELASRWQLVEDQKVVSLMQKLVTIILMDEVDVLCYVLFEPRIEWIVIVELLKQVKELHQVVLVIVINIKLLDLHDHVGEVAHDVAEDYHANEEED